MRMEIQRRKYSPRTEKSYLYWARQYIFFHNKQHPADLGPEHISQFLTHLTSNRHASGSTQAQALNAIAFLYKRVLQIELGDLDFLRNFRRFKNIPTVLSKSEIRALFKHMDGIPRFIAYLLYGAGLRVYECVTLRVQTSIYHSNLLQYEMVKVARHVLS